MEHLIKEGQFTWQHFQHNIHKYICALNIRSHDISVLGGGGAVKNWVSQWNLINMQLQSCRVNMKNSLCGNGYVTAPLHK